MQPGSAASGCWRCGMLQALLPVQELVEKTRIVASVIDDIGAEDSEFPAERHRRLRDEVSAPDHDWIEPEPVGDHVDEPLADKARLETSGRR